MSKKFIRSALGMFAAFSLIGLTTISAASVQATQQNVVQKQETTILKSKFGDDLNKGIEELLKEKEKEDKIKNLVKKGLIRESSRDESSNKKTFDDSYSNDSFWTPTKGTKDKQEHFILSRFLDGVNAKSVHVAFADANIKEILIELKGDLNTLVAKETIKNEKGQKEFVHNFDKTHNVKSVEVKIKDWNGDTIKLTQFGVYSTNFSSGSTTILIVSLTTVAIVIAGIVVFVIVRKKRRRHA